MKRIIKILVLIVLIIMFGVIATYASTATSDLNTNHSTVKPGETFIVTLSVSCQDGINGVIGITYNYDKDKLDLVSEKVGNNFVNLVNGNSIDLISNSTEKIEKADIYILEFKAKETISAQKTASVSVGDLLLDSDSPTDSKVTIKGKNVTITIKPEGVSSTEENEETSKEEQKETNKETKETEKKDSKESTKETEDTTKKEEKNNEISVVAKDIPSNENNTGEDSVKDTTKSNAQLPKTGTQKIIIGAISILSIIAIAVYVAYRKIKF